MKQTTLIKNGTVVLPYMVIKHGWVYIENGCITAIGRQYEDLFSAVSSQIIDAQECFVLPGLVDLHSSAVEREIEPLPNVFFDTEMAFRELEKKTVGHGITTIFHTFSFTGDARRGIRRHEVAAKVIHTITRLIQQKALNRNKIHLRYELMDTGGMETVLDLMRSDAVSFLSIMDCIPENGRFKTAADYHQYLAKTYRLNSDVINKLAILKEWVRKQGEENIIRLVKVAGDLGIPVALDSDDATERKCYVNRPGLTAKGFPVSFKTVEETYLLSDMVLVGAPNIVKRRSPGRNLRAIDAMKIPEAGLLCSDYYPATILHAVFSLADEGMALNKAVNTATLNPARIAGIDAELGSLERGKRADIIIVQRKENQAPAVVKTLVDGQLVYAVDYRQERPIPDPHDDQFKKKSPLRAGVKEYSGVTFNNCPVA